MSRPLRLSLAVAALGGALWLLYAFVLHPPLYRATVKLEINPDNTSIFRRLSPKATEVARERFVISQLEILRSPEILLPVIRKLELAPPDKEQGMLAVLTDAVEAENFTYTALVELSVWHANPQTAANIANTIVTTYHEKRMAWLRGRYDQEFVKFEQELMEQRKGVEAARAKLKQLGEQLRVTDPNPASAEAILPPDTAISYRKAKTRYLELMQRMEQADARLTHGGVTPDIDLEPVKVFEEATPPEYRKWRPRR